MNSSDTKSSFLSSKVNIVIVRYPSPTQWLANSLAAAISTLYPSRPLIALPCFSLTPNSLGTLASPVLLKLAAQEKRSPQEIGEHLIANMQQHNTWLSPKLWMHPSGWLYASFSDSDLAQWLQTLLVTTPTLLNTLEELWSPVIGISKDPILFQLQYAHAHCCRLLRLAQQEKFITLTHPNLDISQFNTSIFWQNTQDELYLQTLTEQNALLALMQFPNSLSPQKQIYGDSNLPSLKDQTYLEWPPPLLYVHHQAQQWSTLFLDFYSECRIFGDLQSTAPKLLQARLAFVLILKRVLAFYLETVLQIEAPVIL